MKLTLYTANCTGNPQNNIYPNKAEIYSADDMLAAVARDHVCAEYRNARRSSSGFLCCDVEVMDCDNDHSDKPRGVIYHTCKH